MERGAIPLADLPGGLDLQATLESGQSYTWRRADGRMYEADRATGGDAWYHTVVGGEVVRARQVDGRLEWESTADAVPLLERLLRLDDDLPAIRAALPADPLLADAWDAYRGMRLVRDPPFRTLVSFICSAQMRVERIYEMQVALAKEYGDRVSAGGETYHAYPTPGQLAAATEAELRDLGLGYRAPYVARTAEMVADGEADPGAAADMPYEDAREWLTRFVGVGQKVADCVCLFSLGHLDAVPLDTWIRGAITDHYPDCERDSYEDTSRAIRARLGADPAAVETGMADGGEGTGDGSAVADGDAVGRFAGYAQTYVFHYLRERG